MTMMLVPKETFVYFSHIQLYSVTLFYKPIILGYSIKPGHK